MRVDAKFCRVQGVARPSSDSEIKFEARIPTAAKDWSGRFKLNGTGGYAGAIPYPRLVQDIGDGFVTAASNMGHAGGESPGWTLNHPEKVKDWGLRAHYYVATAAKSLANAYYGKPVAHSYFEGCSNGGRQAMMMAQRYPELTAFKARGGKLVQFHGWADPIVPPQGSPAYYNALIQFEKLKHLPRAGYDEAVANLSAAQVSADRWHWLRPCKAITACSCCPTLAIAEAAQAPTRLAADSSSRPRRNAPPNRMWSARSRAG